MIPISFDEKIRKAGNSFVITIPVAFARVLEKGKEYKFTIDEVAEDDSPRQ